MASNKISQWLLNLSDKFEKDDYKKRVQQDSDNGDLKKLDIPLVGGYLYIFSRVGAAKRFNRKATELRLAEQNVSRHILREHLLRKSIHDKLEVIFLTGMSVDITVPEENRVLFKEECESFTGLTYVDLGDGNFKILVEEDGELDL